MIIELSLLYHPIQFTNKERGFILEVPTAMVPYHISITRVLAKAHYGIRMRNTPRHAPLSRQLTREPQHYAQRGIHGCDAPYNMIFVRDRSLLKL